MHEHIIEIQETNKKRIISTMKISYFVCQEDLSFLKDEKICNFLVDLRTQNMPKYKQYSSYTNHVAANNFLYCISTYLDKMQLDNI